MPPASRWLRLSLLGSLLSAAGFGFEAPSTPPLHCLHLLLVPPLLHFALLLFLLLNHLWRTLRRSVMGS